MQRTLLDCLGSLFLFLCFGVALGDNYHSSGIKPVIYNGNTIPGIPNTGTCKAGTSNTGRLKISFLGVHDGLLIRETQDAIWIDHLEEEQIPEIFNKGISGNPVTVTGSPVSVIVTPDIVYSWTLKVPKMVVEMTVMLFISLCLFYPGFRIIEGIFRDPGSYDVSEHLVQ